MKYTFRRPEHPENIFDIQKRHLRKWILFIQVKNTDFILATNKICPQRIIEDKQRENSRVF